MWKAQSTLEFFYNYLCEHITCTICGILEDVMKVNGVCHIISHQSKEVIHNYFVIFQNKNNYIQS